MSKFSNLKLRYKIGVGVATGAVILGAAGGAFAYWTTTGAGGGSSTAASSNGTLTLVASFDASSLAPGGNTAVTISAYNNGTSNLYLTSIAAGTISSTKPACEAEIGDFSLTGLSSTPTEIPAGTNSAHAIVVGSDQLNYANTDVNQDACKGANITLSYTSS